MKFLKKFILILTVLTLQVVSSEMQIIVSMVVVAAYFLLHEKYQPYSRKEFNQLETISLSIISINLYAGLLYSSGSHYVYMKPEVSTFLIILLVFANALFYLYWLNLARIQFMIYTYLNCKKSVFKAVTCGRTNEEQFKSKYIQGEAELMGDENMYIIKEDDRSVDRSNTNKTFMTNRDLIDDFSNINRFYPTKNLDPSSPSSSEKNFKLHNEKTGNKYESTE